MVRQFPQTTGKHVTMKLKLKHFEVFLWKQMSCLQFFLFCSSSSYFKYKHPEALPFFFHQSIVIFNILICIISLVLCLFAWRDKCTHYIVFIVSSYKHFHLPSVFWGIYIIHCWPRGSTCFRSCYFVTLIHHLFSLFLWIWIPTQQQSLLLFKNKNGRHTLSQGYE